MSRAKIIVPAILLAGGLALLFFLNNSPFMSPFIPGLKNPGDSSSGQYIKNNPSPIQPDTAPGKDSPGNAGETGQTAKQPGETAPDSQGKAPGQPKDRVEPDTPEPAAAVNAIEQRYRPQFQALRQEYSAKINNLAAAGMNEYMSYKNSGQNPPVLKLVKKYIGAGNALEAECDQRFYALLARMKQDLQEANLPLDLVEQAKKEYSAQKAQRKKQLIKSGLQFAGL